MESFAMSAPIMDGVHLALLENKPRICTRCRETKPPIEFYISKSAGQRYLRRWCKECTRAYFKQFAAKRRKPNQEVCS
jgi:hypothetical protein